MLNQKIKRDKKINDKVSLALSITTYKGDKMQNKICNLKKLESIVLQAKCLNYNRIIDFKEYFKTIKNNMKKGEGKFGFWKNKKTNVLVLPMMIHQHAQGEKVEDHMRCIISTGNTVAPDVMQDIPMMMFDALESLLPYELKAKEMKASQ